MTFLLTLIVTSSVVFMLLVHPISFISLTVVQTLWAAIFTSMTQKSFWYGYILFLVFLGGMLVLFAYIATLASNETFSLSLKMMLLISLLITLIFFLVKFTNITPNDPLKFSPIIMSFNKFYSQNFMLTIIIVMYLLITLLVVVKISNIKQGPLRTAN